MRCFVLLLPDGLVTILITSHDTNSSHFIVEEAGGPGNHLAEIKEEACFSVAFFFLDNDKLDQSN